MSRSVTAAIAKVGGVEEERLAYSDRGNREAADAPGPRAGARSARSAGSASSPGRAGPRERCQGRSRRTPARRRPPRSRRRRRSRSTCQSSSTPATDSAPMSTTADPRTTCAASMTRRRSSRSDRMPPSRTNRTIGHRPGDADDRERGRRVRELVDLPGDRDGVDPVADQRHGHPGEEQREIPARQRAEEGRPAQGGHQCSGVLVAHGRARLSARNRAWWRLLLDGRTAWGGRRPSPGTARSA